MTRRSVPTVLRGAGVLVAITACWLLAGTGAWGDVASVSTSDSPVLGPSARLSSSILISRGQLPRIRPINLTNSPADDRCPAWSPSGDLIAFTSNGLDTDGDGRLDAAGAARGVYTMCADGSGVTGYAAWLPPGDIQGVTWAPDGRALYLIHQHGAIWSLLTFRLDSHAVTLRYTSESLIGQLALSPDGATLYCDLRVGGRWQIYRLAAAGEAAPQRLTSGPEQYRRPVVDRTGAVLCVSDRGGGWRAYRLDPTGALPRALTPGFALGEDLAVAPTADGTRLLLVSTRRTNAADTGAVARLWTVPFPADAGPPAPTPVLRYAGPLTAGIAQDDPAPQVVADREQTMLFVAALGGHTNIFLDDIDASPAAPGGLLVAFERAPGFAREFAQLVVTGGAMQGRARSRTPIQFTLSSAAAVTLIIRSSAGRLIAQPATAVALPAGPQQLAWDGRDSRGRPAPTGLYLVEISAEGAGQQARATVLLRLAP